MKAIVATLHEISEFRTTKVTGATIASTALFYFLFISTRSISTVSSIYVGEASSVMVSNSPILEFNFRISIIRKYSAEF